LEELNEGFIHEFPQDFLQDDSFDALIHIQDHWANLVAVSAIVQAHA